MRMIEYCKIIGPLLSVLLLSIVQLLIGVRRDKRVRQALMVPISAVISIILVIVAQYNFHYLYDAFQPKKVQVPITSTQEADSAQDTTSDQNSDGDVYTYVKSDKSGTPSSVSAQSTQNNTSSNPVATTYVEEKHIHFSSEVALANLIIMGAYLVLKAIASILLWRFADNRKFLETTAAAFYYFDDDYYEWFLKDKWANFRNYLKAIVIALNLAVGIWLGLTWYLGRESDIWFVAFPIIAVIFVNEIFSFLNGKTKEELEFEVMGDAASLGRISNFQRVRQIFEQTLPSPLLFAHSGCEFINREAPERDVELLSNSEEREELAASKYFSSNERYKKVGMDEYKATLEMVNGKNVVFFNPFYRDLSVCLTLPIINALLKGRKCLVVTGRSTIGEDVKDWLTEIITEFSRMESLWRVSELGDDGHPCEVGILDFTNLYDNRLMMANQKFFRDTDFVIFLEPSIIVSTAQISLSILANAVSADGRKPVYCICDRNSDGLVDTMSHVLQTNITTVVAPPVPRCMYTCMCWDADGEFKRQSLFDKQTKYLGNGVELAAIAVKNQIPEVNWYCESKAPIKDIKWISGKYYAALCKFMNIPSQQKSLYEKLKFVDNPWLAPKKKENFLVAEDEFCNMFSALQTYLSRGETQSFVNIISENYLLRDYMRCNREMFVTNPDAIPSVVSDYAKTERNVLFKLLIEMSFKSVSEKEVINEFKLVGVSKTDAMEVLTEMLSKYTNADNSVISVECHQVDVDSLATVTESFYSIDINIFENYFSKSLKTAFYILEEEDKTDSYVDAKLYGQVTQTLLPGQYITYDGKYYLAKTISPQSGVVLRRASDLYDGRKYYRQMRRYIVESMSEDNLQRKVTISDIEISFISADFTVETDGYLEMDDFKDFNGSKVISFDGDPNIEYYSRQFKNKTVMRIKLPRDVEPDEDDEENYRKILFTFCMLLQELFRTAFPSTWQYIAAVTKACEKVEGTLNYLIYPIEGEVEDGYIYIVEDSDMDLGLIGAFERNFDGFFSIIADFLDWHFEKMKEPPVEDPLPQEVVIERREQRERHNIFVRTARRLLRIFGVNREEDVDFNESREGNLQTAQQAAENISGEADQNTNEEDLPTIVPDNDSDFDIVISDTDDDEEETEGEEEGSAPSALEANRRVFAEEDHIPGLDDDPLLTDPDGTDIFEESRINTDPELLSQLDELFAPMVNSKYKEECYLKFGYENIDSRIKLEDVRDYLRVRGWCNNEFTKARKFDIINSDDLLLDTDIRCDFCMAPLTGVSYEKLNDGRIRCNECSVSAIPSLEEFKALFLQIIDSMQSYFDIRIRVPVGMKTTDAESLSKGRGYLFKSYGNAPKNLGYAKNKFGKYSIEIENGSPRLVAIETIVHELTHIWQKTTWSEARIFEKYGAGNKTLIYEGMAIWASIQYMYLIGETYYADKQERYYMNRDDAMGEGFRYYCQKYPLVKDSSYLIRSPFIVDLPF